MKKTLIVLFMAVHSLCFATYYSQFSQDRYVNENYFRNVRDGVFVDIGAHNGINFSNTYFFESELGWSGICIEPIPQVFAALQKNRHCILINGCVCDKSGTDQFFMIGGWCEMLSGLVSKYDPRHVERIKKDLAMAGQGCWHSIIDVKCYTFNELMEQNGITHINFLSIDIEGGEFEVLASIDYSRFEIDVMAVEDNYSDPRFKSFLEEKGFNFVGRVDADLIFVNKNFVPYTL